MFYRNILERRTRVLVIASSRNTGKTGSSGFKKCKRTQNVGFL